MELQTVSQNGVYTPTHTTNDIRFIESNTQAVSLRDIKDKHLIPVFIKDNTPTISQADFIGVAMDNIEHVLGEHSSNLAIRVSHPIKGRTFEARNKKASELEEHEKTIYYERMAFSFDFPSITRIIDDKEVCLSVVGVKAYNNDNLYSYGNALQRFKVGMGFKVKVCTNLCLFTDHTSIDLKVRNLDELGEQIYILTQNIDIEQEASFLSLLREYTLSQKQFATLIGKSRMYNHLPKDLKKEIPELLISDSQVSMVTKSYYNDRRFLKNEDGSISLWNLYNLYTDAVKSSYIDSFMDRSLNTYSFINGIRCALDGDERHTWFLN